ncbi:hypothetical protein C8E01_10336 [Pontibacter virosus]|uniref:Uncharacterized protein n=1 Tax=Pontibacter virosus TaxID=1765052 RepID=A0A2U1B0F9_9BACT|nr:hypothetical protein C8E01_10336 [Pontibacter virosus]
MNFAQINNKKELIEELISSFLLEYCKITQSLIR